MATPVTNDHEPWGRSLLHAARRWFALPIVLGVLGAVLGFLASALAQPSAEVLLRVDGTSADSTAAQRDVATTALELDTQQVYVAAAKAVGGTAADLRTRTEISQVPQSQVISITVTAASADQAISEANNLAEAGIRTGQQRLEAQLVELTERTRDLISKRKLSNNDAESARVSRLGDSLGASQSALEAGAQSISLLQAAQPSRRLPSPPALGLLGLLGGVLLGLAAALVLGTRRGTVSSVAELHQLYPQAPVIGSNDLDSVITLESPSTSTVFVGGVKETPAQLHAVTAAVQETLLATGRDVRLVEQAHLAGTSPSPNGHVDLVAVTLNDTVLRRVSRDNHSLLIIPVRTGQTRLESLDTYGTQLGDRTYLLVDEASPQWN